MHKIRIRILLFTILGIAQLSCLAQDTIRVMTYNVLNYGDACQGPNSLMRSYLDNIISFAKPDILGLVKVLPVKRNPEDFNGYLPVDFPDSLAKNISEISSLNPYSYCSFTNEARGADMNLLFYNEAKLGYIYTKGLAVNITDFNMYKFYYKDPNLIHTNDTTFLYVLLFHTQSGDDATTRNAQLSAVLSRIKARFTSLPNMIIMGDFNTRNSSESCYSQFVLPSDTNYKFNDAPFTVDGNFTYPANWDKNPAFNSFLTTSTRRDANIPNSCGTSGGAKGWYDHILFSNWLLSGNNYMSYIPHSYKTIGNDGNRYGISVNDSISNGKNNSAPPEIINSIFQLSNKYPIVSDFLVKSNTKGISPGDPEKSSVGINPKANETISVTNPVSDYLNIQFRSAEEFFDLNISDLSGRTLINQKIPGDTSASQVDLRSLQNGTYILTLITKNKKVIMRKEIIKLSEN